MTPPIKTLIAVVPILAAFASPASAQASHSCPDFDIGTLGENASIVERFSVQGRVSCRQAKPVVKQFVLHGGVYHCEGGGKACPHAFSYVTVRDFHCYMQMGRGRCWRGPRTEIRFAVLTEPEG
jgi:hypothetical protein